MEMNTEIKPDIKTLTYTRRRAFNKIHVTSWLIYLEKDGFVRCSFQNCNFMAFDVEEMCNHYGYCKGDNTFAKFVCEYCNGRTDSSKKLELHLTRAHNYTNPKPEPSSSEHEQKNPEPADNGKPSRVLVLSWGYFFEKNNFIKCSSCNYLANTLSEMCRHYPVCKQEVEHLLYVCPECKGRTMNVNPLLWHMERSHKIFKAPSQFNHITKTMVRFWERELDEKGFASCLHVFKGQRDCYYIDSDILGIIDHSQSCKGPMLIISKEQCSHCPKWTSCPDKLKQHVAISHESKNVLTSTEGRFDTDVIPVTDKTPKEPVKITTSSDSSKICIKIKRESDTEPSNQFHSSTNSSNYRDSELSLEPVQEFVVTEDCGSASGDYRARVISINSENEGRGRNNRQDVIDLPAVPNQAQSTNIVVKQEESIPKELHSVNLQKDLFVKPSSSQGEVQDNLHKVGQSKTTLEKLKHNSSGNSAKDNHESIVKETNKQVMVVDFEEDSEEEDRWSVTIDIKKPRTNNDRVKETNEKNVRISVNEVPKPGFILKNVSSPSLSDDCVGPKATCVKQRPQLNKLPEDEREHVVIVDFVEQDTEKEEQEIEVVVVNMTEKDLLEETSLDKSEQIVISSVNEKNKGDSTGKFSIEHSKRETSKQPCYALFRDESSSDEEHLGKESTYNESNSISITNSSSSEQFEPINSNSSFKNYLKRRKDSDRGLPSKRRSISPQSDCYSQTKLCLDGLEKMERTITAALRDGLGGFKEERVLRRRNDGLLHLITK